MTIRAAALALSAILGIGVTQADGRAKPKPIRSVGPRLDTARSAESMLTAAAGGTVSSGSRSGVRLTLRVPAGGLAGDTEVRVTPVASIARLPRGARLLGGVQFAPEGTPVGKGTTLTIESGRLRSAKQLHAIVWFGNGSYVSLWPGRRSGGTFTLPVAHFSGVAVYDGPRSGLLSPGGTSRPYYEQVVRPKLQQALTNDAVAEEAVQLWVDWERGMQLAGVGEDYLAPQRAEGASLVPKIVRNVLQKSFERCVSQHDVVEEVRKMIAIGRVAAMAGALADTGSLLDEAFAKADKCARFELDFASLLIATNIGGSTSDTGSTNWNATERVQLSVRGMRVVLSTGAASTSAPPVVLPLGIDDYSYDYYIHHESRIGDTDTCTSTARTASPTAPFQVFSLELTAVDPPQFTLEMSPGEVQAFATGTCSWTTFSGGSGSYPTTTPLTAILSSLFATLHAGEYGGQGVRISDWSYVGGAIWAQKKYDRTISVTDTARITEQTSFTLRHTPQS
jgi:hypothetical protein